MTRKCDVNYRNFITRHSKKNIYITLEYVVKITSTIVTKKTIIRNNT